MELNAYEIALIGGGFTVLGAFIGGYIGYYFSGQLATRQEFNRAATEFRSAFIDEIRFIDTFYAVDRASYNLDIPDVLNEALPKHERALMVFKDGFLCETDRKGIEKAWKEYTGDDPVPWGKYSFSQYKSATIPDKVKGGRELALERINNILAFAKHK